MKTTANQNPEVVQQRLVRLVVPHSKDCKAMKAVARGDWDTPWCGIPQKTLWLSRVGDQRGRSHPWLSIICNATDCPARKIISADAVAMLEPNGV